jgi:hypothetical protein
MPDTKAIGLPLKIVNEPRSENGGFFPPLSDFADYFNVDQAAFCGARKVPISLDMLAALIGLAAAASCFDADYYLDRNPDIRKAFLAGQIKSLWEHFAAHGYFEARLASKTQANPLDEGWYLEQNPDVAQGLKSGAVLSARAHYNGMGRKEGRLPNGEVTELVRIIIAELKRKAA